MSAPTMRTTLLLTEHLGYPPISLVDDIINAVNEIMYKCTQAMEKYLLERQSVDGKDYTDEIKVGIAKLETLWENSVDRSFDKLELYVLRNVLQIPEDLLDSGTFRLKHHESLFLESEAQTAALIEEIKSKQRQLEDFVKLNITLRTQLQGAKKLSARVTKFKKLTTDLLEARGPDNEETQTILKSLQPVDESVKLLISQLRTIYVSTERNCSNERVANVVASHRQLKDDISSRRGYLNNATQKTLLSLLGVQDENGESPMIEQEAVISDVDPRESPLFDNPDWDVLKKHVT